MLTACSAASSPSAASTSRTTARTTTPAPTTAAVPTRSPTDLLADATTCTLTPETIAGPTWFDAHAVRTDIREDRPGTPLDLAFRVEKTGACSPVPNAVVDLWQCDAGGIYSGYQNQLGGLDTRGQVFLRGTQLTGPDGRVRFQTVYPGWYPARTTHVHFKVHLSGNREATSQLYFAEELNREVYGTAPYSTHGQKDTSNTADQFARGAPLLAVTRDAQGYNASMTITVAA